MLAASKVKLSPGRLLIDGQWVEGSKTFDTINPATGEVLTQIAEASSADVDRAVAAARKAFEDRTGAWRKMSASERGRLIWKLADLIEKNIDEIAELETLDNGKPIFESRYVDIPMVVDVLRYYAGWATKIQGETVNTFETAFTYTLREPVGVVGLIIPWNFPLLLASWKLGPALACGSTIVMKPAEQTPLTTLRFGELALEAGIPAGVINILTGGPEVGKGDRAASGNRQDCLYRIDCRRQRNHEGRGRHAEARHARTGRQVSKYRLRRFRYRWRGERRHQRNLLRQRRSLQCGLAIVCRKQSERRVPREVGRTHQENAAGRSLDPKTRLGAIVSQEQMQTVLAYIEAGKKDGAKLIAGGNRVNVDGGKGFFSSPRSLAM